MVGEPKNRQKQGMERHHTTPTAVSCVGVARVSVASHAPNRAALIEPQKVLAHVARLSTCDIYVNKSLTHANCIPHVVSQYSSAWEMYFRVYKYMCAKLFSNTILTVASPALVLRWRPLARVVAKPPTLPRRQVAIDGVARFGTQHLHVCHCTSDNKGVHKHHLWLGDRLCCKQGPTAPTRAERNRARVLSE